MSAYVPIVQRSVVSAHPMVKCASIQSDVTLNKYFVSTHKKRTLSKSNISFAMLDLLVACTEAFNLFQAGDIIDVLQMNQNGLWRGRCRDRVGTFKFINVELLPTRRRKRSSSRSLRYVRCFCARFLFKSMVLQKCLTLISTCIQVMNFNSFCFSEKCGRASLDHRGTLGR